MLPLTTAPPAHANKSGRLVRHRKPRTRAHALQALLVTIVMRPTPARRRIRASMPAPVMGLLAALCAHAPWVGMVTCALKILTSVPVVHAIPALVPMEPTLTLAHVTLATQGTTATRLQIRAPRAPVQTVGIAALEMLVPRCALVQLATSVTCVRLMSTSANQRRA
jgi:hypothetical protein